MATIPTSLGPIGARQFNSNLYVGMDDLVTIQKAVTMAVADGGTFTIHVPIEYAGSDTIAAVTGGSASVYILDERGGQRQMWVWFGGAYIQEAFLIIAIGTAQLNSTLYVGPLGRYPTIQSAITTAAGFTNPVAIIAITPYYTGSEVIGSLTGGKVSIYLSDTRTASPQNYTWNGTKYIPANFEQLGLSQLTSVESPQINTTLFVGPLGQYPTIQSAINAGVAYNDPFMIAITPFYTGSEVIGNLTGGAANIYLNDTRTASPQNYVWNGSKYVPATFAPLGSAQFPGGITGPLTIAGNLTATGTVQGASITATGAITGASAAITGTITAAEVQATDAQFATCEVANSPVRTFANTADTPGGMQWPPIGIGVSTGTAWGASIDPTTLQGKLTLTTTGTSGAATLTGNALNVPQYTAPAQVYPAPGIAVSTGSAWGAPLDPANLANVAYINKANTFTANQTVNGTLTTGDITGGGFLAIPAINIQRTDGHPAVPAGTAILRTGVSGTPNLVFSAPVGGGIFLNFDQGTGGVNFCDGAGTVKATIDAAGNATFNGLVKSYGYLSVDNSSAGGAITNVYGTADRTYFDSRGSSPTTTGSFQFRTLHSDGSNAVNILAIDSVGNAQFNGDVLAGPLRIGKIASDNTNASVVYSAPNLLIQPPGAGGTYFNWIGGTGGVHFGSGQSTEVGSVDNTGKAVFKGAVSGGGGVSSTGLSPIVPGSLNLSVSSNIGYLDSFGTGTGSAASMYLRVVNSTGSIVRNSIVLDPLGNCVVLGALSANPKNFRITHPLDDTKYLTHSCLEGPEIGVYYRGEAVIVDGYAVVTLPDYFEALTFPEDRSVQLTQVWEDAPVFARYAASRVVDGQFTIHATENVTIAWEVKAVRRAGVERLQVETTKPIEPLPEATFENAAAQAVEEVKEESKNDRNPTNTDRDGTSEDGKPKPKKVRA